MARIQQQTKEEHLDYLKGLIHTGFSKSVATTYDCNLLATTIHSAINEKLSVDTIRRFFGVIKSASLPSTYTLDVFSKFVGYKNWNDLIFGYQEQSQLHQKTLLFELITSYISFEELLIRFTALSKTKEVHDLFDQIILIKVQQKDLIFFENVFQFKIIFEYQEIFKYAIYHTIHLLGSLCVTHDWIKEIAIEKYYNVPYAIDYFVEWLVVPEDDYYLKVLEKYHHINKGNVKKTLFYHLIHCTTTAKKGDWNQFTHHYNQITTLNLEVNMLHNILQMRYFGIQLLNDKQFNNGAANEKICATICDCSAVNTKDAGDRVSSIAIITHYLFALENYSLIIDLFEKKAAKYSNILGYWATLNHNQLKVYYAFALLQTKQTDIANDVIKDINPNRFDLNFKKEVSEVYTRLLTF